MNLKELVNLRFRLESINSVSARSQISELFKELKTILDTYPAHSTEDLQSELVKLLDDLDQRVIAMRNELRNQIDAFDEECHQKSLTIYNNSIKYDDFAYLSEKNQQYFNSAPEYNKQVFLEKIKTKVDWRFPAMEIRPNNMFVTQDLVACDPLYLVDTNMDMFSKCQESWNEIYQRRVRYYTINEQDPEILLGLPNGQFALTVCADFFDHRPLELIQRYLNEFYNKLRPGGTVIFTFNDCDYPEGVENFNNIYYCYTPGHTIIEYCNAIGYIVKDRTRLNGASSYLEIQKPGTLTTIRAAQTLGKIIDI